MKYYKEWMIIFSLLCFAGALAGLVLAVRTDTEMLTTVEPINAVIAAVIAYAAGIAIMALRHIKN